MSKFSIFLALDDLEMELLVEGNATPFKPGRAWGPPEDCYPDEGGEVEIENVWLTHPGQTRPIKLEISPLFATLAAWDTLQQLTEDALANQTDDGPEPDYPDYED